MHYVYILKSENFDDYYIGFTYSLQNRLLDHNSGKSKHTTKYKPWQIIWYGAFKSKQQALDFEKYLKTGSGKAFLRKRLIKT